jgi:cyanophycinase-like exopeptidase
MAALPRILAIMGSGETAPTMVTVHKDLLARLPADVPAVLIETPYGFQENADEISERAVGYFAHNVGRDITPIGVRSSDDDSSTATDTARLQTAGYVFAGPGSPTYALRQWRGSMFADAVADKLRTGGVVVFASAAAVGLGRAAVPVYEIYKVGQTPHWVEGLDLLSAAGIDAAVIPHFDNAEGGTHDTRFCYLGARRLTQMEQQLDDGTVVVGVDEHTALILDLDAATATVRGRGGVTIRRAGRELRAIPSGAQLALAALTAERDGGAAEPVRTPTERGDPVSDAGGDSAHDPATMTLTEQAVASARAFDAALERGDGAAAGAAILELEAAIAAWAADTTQSDEGDRARDTLRGLIVRLGAAAANGLADPTARIAPMIDAVVDARDQLRDRRDFALADLLRDAADAAGIELRDTPEGTVWRSVTR